MIYAFLKNRPLSWSALSSFQYSPEQWYSRYILGEKQEDTPEMVFGKTVGERLASDPAYLPQVPRLSVFEHPMRCKFGKIPLVGYADTYEPKSKLYEYKTGKKEWDQKRADEHGQIDMYLLMHYLIEKVRPEDVEVKLMWLPTQQNGDFSISFIDENDVKIFSTRRTLLQVLEFGQKISKTVKAMDEYIHTHPLALPS